MTAGETSGAGIDRHARSRAMGESPALPQNWRLAFWPVFCYFRVSIITSGSSGMTTLTRLRRGTMGAAMGSLSGHDA